MMVADDPGLKQYLHTVMQQLSSWLQDKHLQKLVLAITGVDSEETLERWSFDISIERGNDENANP